jgi:hypothetical protein
MKSLIFLLAASASLLRADLVEQGPKDSRPSGLYAGVARADVTAPVGIPQMNWGSQTHITAEGTETIPMYATALVIGDGKQKFAMVDIDVLAIHRMDDVRRRASELTGIPVDHIRLASTHTHSGPLLTSVKGPVGVDLSKYEGPFWKFWDILGDKIVGAIVEANAHMEPAHMYGAKGIGSINVNRRLRAKNGLAAGVGVNPDGFVDRDLIVARIDRANGRPMAVLMNFQCHGTVLAWENKLISPDWIGPARRAVERALPGVKALYFQGAAGNQGPIEGFTGDIEVAHRLGGILGLEAAALALRIETVSRAPRFEGFVESTANIARQPWRVEGPRDSTIKFTTKVIDVPGREYTPDEVERMRSEVAVAKQKLAALPAGADPLQKHLAEARLRRVSDLLTQWQKPSDGKPVQVRIQALRIGQVAIVAMPGEPFAEIGAAVKKASPFPITMFCGYSSGEGGEYMPIASEYPHAGYEVDRTPYGRGAADKVIREATALYKDLQ